MSPQLTESIQNLSAAHLVLEDLEAYAKGTRSKLLKAIVAEHKTMLSQLTSTFERTFDSMSEINKEVLAHRVNIRNYKTTLSSFRAKEMVWFKLFSIAWEHYVDFVGDKAGDLAPEPTDDTWKEILDVCEKIDDVQSAVDKAVKIKENIEELVKKEEDQG